MHWKMTVIQRTHTVLFELCVSVFFFFFNSQTKIQIEPHLLVPPLQGLHTSHIIFNSEGKSFFLWLQIDTELKDHLISTLQLVTHERNGELRRSPFLIYGFIWRAFHANYLNPIAAHQDLWPHSIVTKEKLDFKHHCTSDQIMGLVEF